MAAVSSSTSEAAVSERPWCAAVGYARFGDVDDDVGVVALLGPLALRNLLRGRSSATSS
jgi:hypothetical protein